MAQTTKTVQLPGKIDTFFGVSLQIIGTIFLARLLMDIGTRILFPFIPQFSEGLGLSIVGLSGLIFIRSIVGITSPVFGMLSDRYGRRKLMASGLLCQAVGVIGLAFSWQWWATLPILFYGLGLTAFLPAQQAYISDQVPYQKRGRTLATIEFSWAATAIFILPVVGWMIDALNWRFPFFLFGVFSLIGTVMVWFRLPPTERHSAVRLSWSEVRVVSLKPNVLASIAVSLLFFITVSVFGTVWGIWLTADFGLNAATLGLIATGIGVAELSGAGLSSLFIDRLGKKRGSLVGLLFISAIFLVLPFTRSTLFMAIAVLVIMGVCVEFTVVSLLPLYSEQVPEARATVFSLAFLGVGIGASIGTPLTAILWERYGLWVVCAVAAGCALIAYNLIWRFIQEASDDAE